MNQCISRFGERVRRHPHKTALLINGADEISYQSLWDNAQKLAQTLGQNAIGSGDVVALEIGKSADYVVGLLACWMAGAAFMPLDPSLPKVRREWMRSAAKPKATLFANSMVVMEPQPACYDASLAYIIFTSGSSGTPKGVMVAHAGILNFIEHQIAEFMLDENSRALWLLSMQFDASISDIGTALLSGATLCIETASSSDTAAHLETILAARAITHLDIPPSLLRMLQPHRMPNSLRTIMIGGEVCPAEIIRQWAPSFRLINIYGPTEATVCTSMVHCTATWNDPSIGKPIPNIHYALLDDAQKPVSPAEAGEIYIGGIGLALGYLNEPNLNAIKFVTLNGIRFFRTGDLARLATNGEYIFLGRKDRQVKIGGQLVAPEEVESVLQRHPQVDAAAVLAITQTHGRMMLVAYFESPSPVSASELRSWLSSFLPKWMIPRRYVQLASLPRNTNGKIDLAALHTWEDESAGKGGVLSTNSTTASLQRIVQAVLQLTSIPPEEADFFDDLGGDSLLALETIFAAEKEGLSLTTSTIHTHRTIGQIAAQLRQPDQQPRDDAITARDLHEDAKLTNCQQAQIATALQLPASADGALLLTGATGFLGGHVLRQLLHHTNATIYCVIRASSEDAARERLLCSYAAIGATWNTQYDARVRVLCGDLTLPQWGLEDESWQLLTRDVASIYHCAATVNMMQSYRELYDANVGATQQVVAFACTTRRKTIHYASTLSVFVAADTVADAQLEDAPFDIETRIHGGYAQSKWVADDFMQQCAASGLPIGIYRFGLITGDSHSGRCASHDYLAMFVRGLLRLGELPSGDWKSLELDVTPVDYAAQAMVSIAQNHQGGRYHIAGASRFSLRMIHDALTSRGRKLAVCDPKHWYPNITDHPDAAAAYMALCRLLKGDASFSRFRAMDLFQATDHRFDQTNTHHALAGTTVTCPAATPALLDLYLEPILAGMVP